MRENTWAVGDWVIYRKTKRSSSPGHRAQNVSPSTKGEAYAYTVDKYWIVTKLLDNGDLRVQTLGGKHHDLSKNDSAMRKPTFWERWVLRRRFLAIEGSLRREKHGNER